MQVGEVADVARAVHVLHLGDDSAYKRLRGGACRAVIDRDHRVPASAATTQGRGRR
jgi:hypothetical protein